MIKMFYSWATFFQAQYSVLGRRNKLSARQPELITQPAACVQIIGRPAHPVIHQPQPHFHQLVTISHPDLPTKSATISRLSFPLSSHLHFQPISHISFPLSSHPPLLTNQPPSAIIPSHYPATLTSHQSATSGHYSFPLSGHIDFQPIRHHQP